MPLRLSIKSRAEKEYLALKVEEEENHVELRVSSFII